MRSIRIKNMRSLGDTGEIELKPINILVGQNSSGKSTFLRTFPLLKQSFTRKINGPILWAGDNDDYVDFGSFEETINRNSKEQMIKLEFGMKYNLSDLLVNQRFIRPIRYNKEEKERYNIEQNFSLEITIKREKEDFISKLAVRANDEKFELDREKEKYILNENEIKIGKGENKKTIRIEDRFTFGNAIMDLGEELACGRELRELKNEIFQETDLQERMLMEDLFYYIAINKFIKRDANIGTLIQEFKEKLSSRYGYDAKFAIKDKVNEEKILELSKIICMKKIGDYGLEYIYGYFRNISYIAPIRAHAERYYKLMNLSVNELDAQGKNLPILINSMNNDELKAYQDWTEENFGFKCNIEPIKGHLSINVEIGNVKTNLADTGFGYSQILPIITELWLSINNRNDGDTPMAILIEQPELHLHPALQAKLVDAIVKMSNNNKNTVQFIIETHSETIINRLGNLIYKNKIDNDNINIVIFNKKSNEKDTEIEVSKFDKEGYLKDWPIGFFSADEIK